MPISILSKSTPTAQAADIFGNNYPVLKTGSIIGKLKFGPVDYDKPTEIKLTFTLSSISVPQGYTKPGGDVNRYFYYIMRDGGTSNLCAGLLCAQQNTFIETSSSNFTIYDEHTNINQKHNYDVYLLLNTPSSAYIGPVSATYSPTTSTATNSITLGTPQQIGTAKKNTDGTVAMQLQFTVSWDKSLNDPKNFICYINVHNKQSVSSSATSIESHELYPELNGATSPDQTCSTPFSSTSVKQTLTFNKLNIGANYFVAFLRYNSFQNGTQQPQSNFAAFTVSDSNGKITGQATALPAGTAQGSGSGSSNDCPLASGGLGLAWVKDTVILKPICIGMNLVANLAASAADWTIRTFFVKSLGLTGGAKSQ